MVRLWLFIPLFNFILLSFKSSNLPFMTFHSEIQTNVFIRDICTRILERHKRFLVGTSAYMELNKITVSSQLDF